MPCRRLPFVIGNLAEGELSDLIAESAIMKALADPAPPEGCEKCRYLERCHGGAKCVTYAQTGKLNARDVNCWIKE